MSISTAASRLATRADRLTNLRSKIHEIKPPGGKKAFANKEDDRYWKPQVDKAGVGSAVIRFLPAKVSEDFPFVELYTHGFQGPSGKWFIDNCPTSIGDTCPACEANKVLWNTNLDANKQLASSRKRRLSYISNILVVSDPKHPENNGKVFLYRYGKKIFEMISGLIDPLPPVFDEPAIQPRDPFDLEFGCNFKLRVMKVASYPNYDKSTFEAGETALGSEAQIDQVISALYSLDEIRDPKNFKPYAALGGVLLDRCRAALTLRDPTHPSSM